jgi:hypothetical protein
LSGCASLDFVHAFSIYFRSSDDSDYKPQTSNESVEDQEQSMVVSAFSDDQIDALRAAKILGVRAGTEHRYTGVWVVVVDDRVFARSWSDKPTGWFRAFKKEPSGTIQAGKLEIPVRGKPVRSARLRDAVTTALAEKYNTKGSQKWVEGFRDPARVLTTLEFVPE